MSGWMLALDASTPRCVVTLGRIDEDAPHAIAGVQLDDSDRQASSQLHQSIVEVCTRASIPVTAIACIACGRGPGTFTGTRVAVATAKGLAEALDCRVVGVSTLAAVAATAGADGRILALLDARRGEVYAGSFEITPTDLRPCDVERCAPIATVLAGRRWDHVVGPGLIPYDAFIAPPIPRTPCPGPTVDGLWRAAHSAYRAGLADDAAQLDAVYLRDSYAELGVNVPKRPPFRSPFV